MSNESTLVLDERNREVIMNDSYWFELLAEVLSAVDALASEYTYYEGLREDFERALSVRKEAAGV